MSKSNKVVKTDLGFYIDRSEKILNTQYKKLYEKNHDRECYGPLKKPSLVEYRFLDPSEINSKYPKLSTKPIVKKNKSKRKPKRIKYRYDSNHPIDRMIKEQSRRKTYIY